MRKLRLFASVALGVALAALSAFGRGSTARQAPSAAPSIVVSPVATNAARQTASIAKDGSYTSREQVALYLRTYRRLPSNFITKAEARRLGWSGGPVEPFAPGKSIGGDHFGNYERRLPQGRYRECDIDTRGRPRGAKRLIYTEDIRRIYYTADHYRTFEAVP